ncbi:hypothetical protein OF83DRAFT_645552 [Amylostereum chailletii]|nr:hypothetical protein OF83DRAFT_645552 [Amylostereum chailletii]
MHISVSARFRLRLHRSRCCVSVSVLARSPDTHRKRDPTPCPLSFSLRAVWRRSAGSREAVRQQARLQLEPVSGSIQTEQGSTYKYYAVVGGGGLRAQRHTTPTPTLRRPLSRSVALCDAGACYIVCIHAHKDNMYTGICCSPADLLNCSNGSAPGMGGKGFSFFLSVIGPCRHLRRRVRGGVSCNVRMYDDDCTASRVTTGGKDISIKSVIDGRGGSRLFARVAASLRQTRRRAFSTGTRVRYGTVRLNRWPDDGVFCRYSGEA